MLLSAGGVALGVLGTLEGGVRWDKKSSKGPDTVLGAAERDVLMPTPAFPIPGGFEYPTLRAVGCSAEGGHRFQTQRSWVVCFIVFFPPFLQ